MRGSLADDGSLVKLQLDYSGTIAATSGSDKSVSIWDIRTGDCMATMCGHSEMILGIRFSPDAKFCTTIGGDGCIFVWRFGQELSMAIQSRWQEMKAALGLNGMNGSNGEIR